MVQAPKAPPVPTPTVKTTQQLIRIEVDNNIAQHENVPYWDHEHVWSELYCQHELGHSEDIRRTANQCWNGGSDGFRPIPTPDRMSGD